jgi:predicted RNA-binding Zn-ribbon protein involved in translation (DUF1610 family)
MAEVVLRCAVCRALLDEEDLFCSNCGTEAPHTSPPRGATRSFTHHFRCSSCGASMSYDARAQGLRCPFCAAVEMTAQPDAHTLAPRRVVPFGVSASQAVESIRRWLGRGWWRPSDLSTQALLVALHAVYVPYWVFRAQTHTYFTADSSVTPPGARADWYPVFGEHRGEYDGLLVAASGALTHDELQGLAPFDLSQGVPPDHVDLDNVTVEQFSVPRRYARPLAQQGLEELERQACMARYLPGRSRNVKVNLLLQGLASEPILLPVWIAAYRYGGRVYRCLVNGQNGRATGAAPLSWLKIAAAVAVGLALAAAALVAVRLLIGW